MYKPSLEFLCEVIDPGIRSIQVDLIKQSATPAAVYRIHLEPSGGTFKPSIIIKRTRPNWPNDPYGQLREPRFYTEIFPHLGLPDIRIYYAGEEPGRDSHVVIMEDLAYRHKFPAPSYAWNQDEIHCILDSYALLHTISKDHLPKPGNREWLMSRHEERVLSSAAKLPAMVEELTFLGVFKPVKKFSSFLAKTLEDIVQFREITPTLLHNDVYTPNIGLPKNPEDGGAVLIDWEMLGFGLAELDLAFMFLQPFRSHQRVNREAALGHYWRRRHQLEGTSHSCARRVLLQRYADSLWVLWLLPVAHDRACSPHPKGSSIRTYWDSFFPVLEERLLELCAEF